MNRLCRVFCLAGLLAQTLPAADEIDKLTNRGSENFLHGRYLEALEQYQQALQHGGGALVLLNLGRLYEQLGQDDGALASYQRALATNPSTEERVQALTSLGGLWRRRGDFARALESYRAAGAWQEMGTVQALDLHDLEGALAAFSHLPDAHLLRGEVLYRLGRSDQAIEEFRAAGNHWIALYELGRIRRQPDQVAQAIPYMQGVPEATSDLLPRKRAVFDTVIEAGTADPAILFGWIEAAHTNGNPPPALPAVQAKLSPGTILMEYWHSGNRIAAVWATHDRAGIGSPATADPLSGIPIDSATNLIIVPAGALNGIAFETLGSPPLIERHGVSYLPNAALLLRDHSWRAPMLPWQTRIKVVRRKTDIATGTPILDFQAPAVADRENPNRSRIELSGSESLFRAEAQDLPLAGTDLVTLAGGNRTLAEAFLAAGARSVVFPVEPAPTDFLQRFNGNLAKGQPPATALRNTKLALLHAGALTHDWSAFILMGDGEAPVRGVLSWWWIVAIVCVGGRIGVFIFRLPRRAS